MTEKIATVVVGAGGAMGQTLVRACLEADDIEIVGATDAPGAAVIGQPLASLVPGAPDGVLITDDPLPVFAKAHAILDFTVPAATVAHAALAAQARAVHVIGTTGLSDEDITKIDAAARHATIVRAGNMSLGVNLLTALTQKVAAALGEEFDIEVVEMHHHRKVDAPSGTALMLGEAAARGRGVSLPDVRDSARDGITGARKRGDIGFAALRGGDVVGEHEVIFAGLGERITLKHIATDRILFARGAVTAARWGQGRGPGAFDMMDVLGLS